MKSSINYSFGQPVGMALSLLSWHLCQPAANANPVGGSASQGSASFKSSGSQLTVTTSAFAHVNWQSFNIAHGETTTFVQPSASSVVWNQINDPNPSQILGTLNANGYIVLQNSSGFVVGGQASINTHGLLLTTAPVFAPDFSSGGPWSFSAPPPSAKIINYGQINIFGGGSAFLIANDIENNGIISAPSGNIGLYAGEKVLVSLTPDGRSLSAQVTLPQGSVDNEGNLIADGGAIAAQVQTVNQNGLIQANTVQEVNGVIELVASDSLTLGASSDISAQGENSPVSASAISGGSVTLQSAHTFADLSGSTINVSGGTQGGNGGQITISAPQMSALNSSLNGQAVAGYANGSLTVESDNINLNAAGSPVTDALALNAGLLADTFSQVSLQAANNLDVASTLTLNGASATSSLGLTAGNNLTLDTGANLVAGKNWDVNLSAGATLEAQAGSIVNISGGSLASVPGQATTLQMKSDNLLALDQGSSIIDGGGLVSLQAANLNQNGLIQDNSAQAVNGTINLLAEDTLTLGANSDLEANGLTSASPGGTVNLQSGNMLALDQGSAITVNGGKISLQAATINQSGRIQADSANTVAGAINVDATAALNLGASSDIEANGDHAALNSPGGSITLQAGTTFTDQAGSLLGVAGGTQGGPGGQLTITAPQMTALNSSLNGSANSRDANGTLNIDTTSILLNSDGGAAPTGLALNANSFATGFSTIALQAADSLEVAAPLNVPDKNGVTSSLSLVAGNTINVDAGAAITTDAGHLSLNAATVNQNGRLQANSVATANGVIEIVASQAINLGATSTLSAQGDATSAQPSPGGFVVLLSGNTFADTASSSIDVAGQSGGQDGIIEILGNVNSNNGGTLQSSLSSSYALLINPYDLTLTANPTDTSTANPLLNVGDLANYSQIDLHALDNIEVASTLTLPDAPSTTSLSLSAGNNLTLDPGANLVAGQNWNVNLTAGSALPAGAIPAAGSDGIYLNGGAFVQTQNGDISANAANEVIIQDSTFDPITGHILSPSGAIRTLAGGNINVTAQFGDVNSGDNVNGFDFGLTTAPWYDVNAANLGGISTAAGGNVSITAGGSVTSYLPTQYDYNVAGAGYDGGSGAFGGGNVTIIAGTTVAGNYVLANGIGSITAGANAGIPVSDTQDEGFALSLVKGSWTVNAPSIYLDDVMNPNGVFNDANTSIQYGRGGKPLPSGGPGAHLFDYDPDASVTLDGANSVEITGASVPLVPLVPGSPTISVPIPILLPPSLTINAGAGGITLDANVILFPSPDGNVNLTTINGGNFVSRQNPNDLKDVVSYNFQMSDSGNPQFNPLVGTDEASENFGYSDHAATPPELNNPNPVEISISGSIEDLNLFTTKETDLTVAGNMFNASLIGENLHANDVTTVNVAGSVTFSPIYALDTLTTPLNAAGVDILSQVVDDSANSEDPYSAANPIPAADVGNASALTALAQSETLQKLNPTLPPDLGFVYDSTTKQLGYAFQMNSSVSTALQNPLVAIQYAYGQPAIALGQASLGQNPAMYYFLTTPVTFNPLTIPATGQAPVSAVAALYQASQNSVANGLSLPAGFQIGGPGKLIVNAGSVDLGASDGIVSWGAGNGAQVAGEHGVNYSSLGAETGSSGAAVTVNVTGDLGMLTSTIASVAGGDVNVTSTGGEIDLGLAGVPFSPPNVANLAYGIFTAGAGDVNVTASGNINIDTARIATFNGGNVNVESLDGDVNAGNGINQTLNVPLAFWDASTMTEVNTFINDPRPYGSGILALAPTTSYQVAGSSGLPGNINVLTPNGDIVSTLGGISQFALNGNVAGGPVVNLVAGTPGEDYIKDPSGLDTDSAGHIEYGLEVDGVFTPEGNIDLGKGGVVGGTVNLSGQGNITGLIVSHQNLNITSQQNVDVTAVAGGGAKVSGQSVSGVIVAVGNASVSGQDVAAAVFSTSASENGGAATSTVGAATASASSQAAASQNSKQATASTTDSDSTDLDQKKKGQSATLKIKRVTVILPGKPTASLPTPDHAL